MSVITVVRRYRCWEARETKTSAMAFIRQEGFLQICGSSDLREMLIISDQVASLKLYKLSCNCQYCTSFSHDSMMQDRVTVEPFMSAVNIIFNTLAKFNYELQSTTSVQNQNGSTSTTWIWIRKNEVKRHHYPREIRQN